MTTTSANKDYFELENYSSEYQTCYVDKKGAGPKNPIQSLSTYGTELIKY